MERCTRCVTPTSYPGLKVDAGGVCNHCREHEHRYAHWEEHQAERTRQLESILRRARRRSVYYDALVPLSGGKDSTYVLYVATKELGLKVLCYTFVNGFQSEIARQNIAAAVEASGADHFAYAPSRDLMMRLYRHFTEHTGMFCPVCMRGITAGTFFVSSQFRIPLVLSGSSERTEERAAPEFFQDGQLSYFKNVLRAHPFPEDVRALLYDRTLTEKAWRALFLLSRGKIALGRMDLYLPDYLEWNYARIYQTITTKMGWRALPDRDEHVDCFADPIVHHFVREIRVPELTPSTLRCSAVVRVGQMTRPEALEVVERERRDRARPKDAQRFLDSLGMSEQEFVGHMKDGSRHMRYQPRGKLRSLVAAIKSRRVV
jgi:hypothetical protein